MQVSESQNLLNCCKEYAEMYDGNGEDFMEKVKIEEPENEDEDDEFSFPCTIPNGSPISAEDAFQNGQIRPIFQIFNRDLLFADSDDSRSTSSLRPPLKKLFVQEPDLTPSSETDDLCGVPEGSYCEWTGKAVEASPEVCKKSNSTGFSKVWRFRDLGFRSNSDGKDAFVFFSATNGTTNTDGKVRKSEKHEKVDGKKNSREVRTKGVKGEMASAHERHYARKGEMNGGIKRRSYLPYRPELVGFFTNVNGMSRNVHPF